MKAKDTPISNRKDEHIHINMDEDVQSKLTNGLEHYRLIHQALPEISLEQVNLGQTLFGKHQPVPVFISSMTGGTDETARVNRNLAIAAQEVGLAMGVGSQRIAIEDKSTLPSFKIRNYAPDILLFANLGAVQLNYGYSVDECRYAIDMIQADALVLHLNPLQEALQPEGNHDFSNLLEKITLVRKGLHVPLIVKEVGWGISIQAAQMLFDAGVDAVDVAGAGGTSWSQVERYRINDSEKSQTTEAFIDWGIPTADSLQNVRKVSKDWITFASGGLQNGIEIAKCLALGASLGGMARKFLKAGYESSDKAIQVMQMIVDQIRVTMFASGASRLSDLTPNKLIHLQ